MMNDCQLHCFISFHSFRFTMILIIASVGLSVAKRTRGDSQLADLHRQLCESLVLVFQDTIMSF